VRIFKLSSCAIAAAVLGLTACESTSPSLFDDATVSADLAASAGDAIAAAIESMAANEGEASLPSVIGDDVSVAPAVTYLRTRTCYDATNAVVSDCTPINSVRKIVTHVEVEGDRSGSRTTAGGSTATWSGRVFRVSDDTLTRTFASTQPPVEVSRTHSDLTIVNDTTNFSEGEFTRNVSEAATDTIRAVTWNLPRSQNPFPVSGYIVRVVAAKVTLTRGSRSETREIARTVRVNFPPDAQGNVVLTVNNRTCNLNLVTHVVSNCQ
jgi:hypothetical protein